MKKIKKVNKPVFVTTDEMEFIDEKEAISHQTNIDIESNRSKASKELWAAFGLPKNRYTEEDSIWEIRNSVDEFDYEAKSAERESLADNLEKIFKEYFDATGDDGTDIEDMSWNDMFSPIFILFCDHHDFCAKIMSVFSKYAKK
ncbi:MAG: hypothetical protein WC401_10860 [Bacteroidales bacterium]|jgi:hypothetical protein